MVRSRETWDELADDVKARPGTALVSEELLCGSPPEHIERVLESLAPVPVHVILAARDIGRQVPAEWQQSLRGPVRDDVRRVAPTPA